MYFNMCVRVSVVSVHYDNVHVSAEGVVQTTRVWTTRPNRTTRQSERQARDVARTDGLSPRTEGRESYREWATERESGHCFKVKPNRTSYRTRSALLYFRMSVTTRLHDVVTNLSANLSNIIYQKLLNVV